MEREEIKTWLSERGMWGPKRQKQRQSQKQSQKQKKQKRNKMVATRNEAVLMVALMLKWMPLKVVKRLITDSELLIGEKTDNESIRDTIQLLKEIISTQQEAGCCGGECGCKKEG